MTQRLPWLSLVSLCGGLALACAALPVRAAPHVHGAAQLDVATEPKRISLQLHAPLEALLGFERAPRNDAERRLADTVLARLKAADALFRIDPAAGCRIGGVEIDAAPLAPRPPAPSAGDGHADLEASFALRLRAMPPGRPTSTSACSTPLHGMRRIEVQMATPRGQFKRTLQRPATRDRAVALTRARSCRGRDRGAPFCLAAAPAHDCLAIDALAGRGRRARSSCTARAAAARARCSALLAGVLVPRSGQRRGCSARTGQRCRRAARDRCRADHVGYIFQQFNLLPYLSVIDNVLLPCRFSARRARARRRAGGSPRGRASAAARASGIGEALLAAAGDRRCRSASSSAWPRRAR